MGKEKFSCPHCGLVYNFRPDWAGQKAKCKCCKNAFTVPDQPTIVRNPKPKPISTESSVPEATIFIGDTPVAPAIEIPSAPAQPMEILDAEPVPFLEPIDEPPVASVVPSTPAPAADTHGVASDAPGTPAASSAPDPFLPNAVPMNDPLANYASPNAGLGTPTGGTTLQRPKKAKASAGPSITQGILAHLKTRPLVCALTFATLTVFFCCLVHEQFFQCQ